jgi:hypothetical protein
MEGMWTPLSFSLVSFVVVIVVDFLLESVCFFSGGLVLMAAFFLESRRWFAPSSDLVPALPGPLVRRLRGLALLRWIGVSVGMRRPCCLMVRNLSPSFLPSFPSLTYLAGPRRMRPELPGRTRARTAGGRGLAAFRMAAGCRTQCPAWGRRRQASRRTRPGRSSERLLLARRRPWDQCPRLCRHGSAVRRTCEVLSVPGRTCERSRGAAVVEGLAYSTLFMAAMAF